jgi:hyaluronoglucosaminidase
MMLALAALATLVSVSRLASGPSPPRAPALPPSIPEPPLVGVVEGFYGPAWSVAATARVLAALSRDGFNTFVYAPKSDPYARARWATPYPPKDLAVLKRLVELAAADHLRFVYSVSPGLSIQYSSAQDRAALWAKIEQVARLGVQTFMLSFDDIPPDLQYPADIARYPRGLGQAQSRLADWILAEAEARHQPLRLLMTPTDYWGLTNGPYWEALARYLNPGVDVLWTGPEVLSPRVTSQEVEQVREDVGHPLILWDNYPVNDYTYVVQRAPRLFLGPVQGRGPHLPAVLAGYLANPMLQPDASLVALNTLATYLRHPRRYRPKAALRAAVAQVAGNAAAPFLAFAEDCSASFLTQGHSLSPWPTAIADFVHHPAARVSSLVAVFQQMTTVGRTLNKGRGPLFREIGPWTAALAAEGAAGLTACHLWQAQQTGLPTAALAQAVAQDLSALEHNPYRLDTSAPVDAFLSLALAHRPS